MSYYTGSGPSYGESTRQTASRAAPGHNRASEDTNLKALLFSGLGSVVAAIPNSASASAPSSGNLVTGFNALASYSWLESTQPKIVVPSAPPVWRQPSLPITLSQDTGKRFVDQNAFRIKKYPLVPLISAIQCEQAGGSDALREFKFSKIDVVSDRNGLRKLLRWIQGGTDVKDFRIDVQLVGGTVIFTRHEAQNEDESFGYGKAFETEMTRHDPDETGHHRIVTYTLGGVRLLVRFELDACLPEALPRSSAAAGQANIDALTAALGRTTISPPATAKSSNHVTVVKGGKLVAQSGTMELKTRSRTTYDKVRRTRVTNTFDWTEVYLQLVLSQTQHLALGWHDRGTFSTIERKTLRELEQGPIGRAQHNNLVKLGEVLKRICVLVKERGEGELLSLVCENGALTLRRHTDRPDGALPAEMLQLFKTS